jgi:hypothetical protein
MLMMGDTEVLSEHGWLRLDRLQKGVSILTANTASGDLHFAPPAQIIKRHHQGMVFCWDGFHHSAAYTQFHRFVGFTPNGTRYIRPAREVAVLHPNQVRVPVSGNLAGFTDVPEPWVRLAEAIRADGSIDGSQVRFRVRKQRKILRLKLLASACGFTLRWSGDRASIPKSPFRDWIVATMGTRKSLGPWVLELKHRLRTIWMEETVYWDGCDHGTENTHTLSSARKDHADWLQAIAVTCGYRLNFSKRDNARGFNEHNPYAVLYSGTVAQTDLGRAGTKGTTIKRYNGELISVTVPSGELLVRCNGKAMITGDFRVGRKRPACAVPKLRDLKLDCLQSRQ